MNIEGRIALVTGANRGLGKAYVAALLAAGAAKVYAGMREPVASSDPRVKPVKLDVTAPADVAAAAFACGDIDLLINNAGIMLLTPALTPDSGAAMRREMEVNVFGVLAMMQAFAPILAKNGAKKGGSAIVNMLSVVSWFTYPLNATYCASKHAALAITEGARMQLKAQGTRVLGVYAGFIDTDMAADIEQPKTSPQQVAERTLEGLRTGKDHVLADERAEYIWKMTRSDPAQLTANMQQIWDQTGAAKA
jgi:NAD(P)-dependent dehydrogenase (short-subunit alcohol dehydrogenase family)